MSGVICINCEGWGCIQCTYDRQAAKGGEQGPNPLEVQVETLRAELETVRGERDRALAELALLRVPGGQA